MSSDEELLGADGLGDLDDAGVTSQALGAEARGLIDAEAENSAQEADQGEPIAPEAPGEFEDFIDDEPVSQEGRSARRGEKRRREEGESDLSEDDRLYDLDEEDRQVIGLQPKPKHRRLKKKNRIEAKEHDAHQDVADRIAQDLFGDSDLSVDIEDEVKETREQAEISEDFSDEDEMSQFIVDDNGAHPSSLLLSLPLCFFGARTVGNQPQLVF